MTAETMHDWHVTYRDPKRGSETIRALYPADDLPGWVTLKDDRHKIVAAIPADQVVSVRRCANDPDVVRGAFAKIGGVHPTGQLPASFDGLAGPAQIEIALRTAALAALLRDRADRIGPLDGLAVTVPLGGEDDGGIVTLDYVDDDDAGPSVRVVLSGYEPHRPEPFEPTSAAVRRLAATTAATLNAPPPDGGTWTDRTAAGDVAYHARGDR